MEKAVELAMETFGLTREQLWRCRDEPMPSIFESYYRYVGMTVEEDLRLTQLLRAMKRDRQLRNFLGRSVQRFIFDPIPLRWLLPWGKQRQRLRDI